MKNLYQILYGVAALLLLIVLLGGTLTKPVFNSYSVKTLETAGVKRSSIDSIDSSIDDMVYGVKKMEFQIERIKNIFSDKEIDEAKYRRVKNEVFAKNIYTPINELLIVGYRIGFLFVSLILFLSAVIIQLIYRSRSLRKRVEKLEEIYNSSLSKN
ncbi:MAG: hypothetical protein IT280_08035 [Ignavibacteria bacterium]|nr:hypothetical protein [Ignavibacteria bacterium]